MYMVEVKVVFLYLSMTNIKFNYLFHIAYKKQENLMCSVVGMQIAMYCKL